MPDPAPAAAPTKVTLSRPAWAALAIAGLLLLGTLGLQIALLEDQRSTTDQQLAATAKQADTLVPLARQLAPVVEQTREDLPRTRRVAKETLVLARELTPLAQRLDEARAPEQLQAAGALARTLLSPRADVAGTLHRLRHLVADVERAQLPQLTAELLRRQRLRRLLVRTTAVLGEVRARDTVQKVTRQAELAPEQLRILEESRRIQAETLAIQRESVSAIRQILELTRETERHAENLDRKTGGEVPRPAAGS